MKILLITTKIQKEELWKEHDEFVKRLWFDNINTESKRVVWVPLWDWLFHLTIEEASWISREIAEKYDIHIYLWNQKVINWFTKKVESIKWLNAWYTRDFIWWVRWFKNKKWQMIYIWNSMIWYEKRFKKNWQDILYFLVRWPVLESQIRLSEEITKWLNS